jgi:hypothetical protein
MTAMTTIITLHVTGITITQTKTTNNVFDGKVYQNGPCAYYEGIHEERSRAPLILNLGSIW